MRLAFLGFRHGHIMGLYKSARRHESVQVVAASEEHGPTAESLRKAGTVELTHENHADVLANVPCDAVAVGDYYGRRGEIIIAALEAAKHVIADKPICIRRDELDRIEQLAKQKKLAVGCLLDLRASGAYATMRRLIAEGAIGEVQTAAFTAQHPLLFGSRPEWYFEEGRHGGTINDIAIHALDAIPWITGREMVEVIAARAWNARLKQVPHFQDAAQLMLRMDNGGGLIGDVSYLAPDGCGYKAPQYWRLTCHGSEGMIEAQHDSPAVTLAQKADKSIRSIDADPGEPDAPFKAFSREVAGQAAGGLTTTDVLKASRKTLMIQEAADTNRHNVPL